jgi:hypothetical protein
LWSLGPPKSRKRRELGWPRRGITPPGLEEAERLGEPVQTSVDRRGVKQALLRSEDGCPILLGREWCGRGFARLLNIADGLLAELHAMLSGTPASTGQVAKHVAMGFG